ncbi:MAG: type II toxin-antitoxin system VapC family toxin [Acidobacteriota bacterium]
MRLLLDTGVLIDLALGRPPHAEAASRLLDHLEQRPGEAFIAWHTISNFYCLVEPDKGRTGTREFLLDLVRFVEVSPTTTDSVRFAGGLRMKDFEDAMQVAAAVACKAEVIATRNVRDYAKAPVRAATPTSLMREWA